MSYKSILCVTLFIKINQIAFGLLNDRLKIQEEKKITQQPDVCKLKRSIGKFQKSFIFRRHRVSFIIKLICFQVL